MLITKPNFKRMRLYFYNEAGNFLGKLCPLCLKLKIVFHETYR